MGEFRKRRIESAIKEIVSNMILRHDIKDPRLDDMVIISEVSVSGDTKHARVYVSYYGESEVCTKAVETLNHAAGFIQQSIAQKLKLRNTPKLVFFEDHSIERGFRITRKLKELVSEKNAGDETSVESTRQE